jgi:predicted nucleic acid-binding protein
MLHFVAYFSRFREACLRVLIDSSSLIVLARVKALPALHDVFGRVGLIPSVYEEVVIQGQQKGFADAEVVARAVEDGWFSQLTLTGEEQRYAVVLMKKASGISLTDAETLTCARSRQLTLLIEDRRARNVARAENLPYITIQVFPLYGVVEPTLSVAQGDVLLARIGRAMNTDFAVVEALRAAVQEINRSRRKEP